MLLINLKSYLKSKSFQKTSNCPFCCSVSYFKTGMNRPGTPKLTNKQGPTVLNVQYLIKIYIHYLITYFSTWHYSHDKKFTRRSKFYYRTSQLQTFRRKIERYPCFLPLSYLKKIL